MLSSTGKNVEERYSHTPLHCWKWRETHVFVEGGPLVVFFNTQCVQTPGSEIPFLGLTPTEMHVQEAKDRCKRIFNVILFVRAKHFKQNKYSLGSNELGLLFAGNTGNHRTKRECVFANTHMHIYRPQRVQC